MNITKMLKEPVAQGKINQLKLTETIKMTSYITN